MKPADWEKSCRRSYHRPEMWPCAAKWLPFSDRWREALRLKFEFRYNELKRSTRIGAANYARAQARRMAYDEAVEAEEEEEQEWLASEAEF